MSDSPIFNFSFPQPLQNQFVEKQGFEMTMFTLVDKTKVGYEDIDNKGKYIKHTIRGFIDFNPQRRVFYHFNWLPDDQADLVAGFFKLSDPVTAECLVRTRNLEQVTPYGDFIFKIVKVFDEGKFKVLKRTCFMRPINDATLYKELI